MQGRLRELEILQRGSQADSVIAADVPVLDKEDVDDLEDAPEAELEAA